MDIIEPTPEEIAQMEEEQANLDWLVEQGIKTQGVGTLYKA